MNGPGTLKIAFIYRDKQTAHPLARFCPPLPAALPGAAEAMLPAALPLAGATALFDVGSKFIETGVSSLVDAVSMRMRAEATTLDATIPVDGFYKAGGINGIDGATLVLHNGVDRMATDPSFNLSLSVVVSPDRTAFRLRVHIWHIDRFLNPKPHALGQTAERDWVLRIEFLTPGSGGLGSRAAFVELAFSAVTLDELRDALYSGQDLHWLPMPAVPVALTGGSAPGNAGHYLPFNVRATIVETTKPGLFAKWVEESLVASKATLAKAAASEFRSAFDPAQKAAEGAKQLETANTAFAGYRKAWDTLKSTVSAAPTAPAAGASQSEIAKQDAARNQWEADVAIQEKALSLARSTAVVALHNAGIGWPGDFPKIVTPSHPSSGARPNPVHSSILNSQKEIAMSVSKSHVCASPFPVEPPDTVEINGHTKGAVLNSTKWKINESITVRFLGGDPGLQARVRAVAEEWTDIAGLTFQFVNEGPADIRISFVQDNRSWSYIGTDCRKIVEPAATMNFGWLTPESTDDVLRPVVLHEFGHAIGMIHEHQNPEGGIDWNMDAVKHDLSGPPNNWDPATIENNMFKAYPPEQVTGTKVDFESIMMYPLPVSWTNDGTSAGFNKELSDTDRQFIATVYPT